MVVYRGLCLIFCIVVCFDFLYFRLHRLLDELVSWRAAEPLGDWGTGTHDVCRWRGLVVLRTQPWTFPGVE